MDYSTMLSQAQITVVIGLLCVLVLKKKMSQEPPRRKIQLIW